MARTMMIQERDGGLHLLQGIPRRWLEQGQEIRVTEAPTWYGPLSLSVTSKIAHGSIRLQLSLPARLREFPIRVHLRLPGNKRVVQVWVAGQPYRDFDARGVTLRNLQDQREIIVRVE
jgi:hypothetical protein